MLQLQLGLHAGMTCVVANDSRGPTAGAATRWAMSTS